MTQKGISRRSFIASSGATLAGTLAIAGGPIALLAPSRAWSLDLVALDHHVGATLLRFTRHLYPHDTLEDAVYALAVKDLDTAAAGDPEVAKMYVEGVAALDDAAEGVWLDLDDAQQLEIVSAQSNAAMFQAVRGKAVVSLYNNELAFAHFGYEGPAFEKGGYIGRGFNDLNWLPQPSEAASPEA